MSLSYPALGSVNVPVYVCFSESMMFSFDYQGLNGWKELT
jgi:hypothetical protein